MSKNESNPDNYNGPESNDLYEDTEVFQSFDDLDDDFPEENTDEVQSTRGSSASNDIDDEEEEDEEKEQKKVVKDAKAKKEAAKKERGQKSDDLDALDTEEEEEESEEEEEDEEEEEKEEEKDDEEEESEEEAPKKDEEKQGDKKAKGKPSYVTIDGETYALDSNAEVSVQVDGKPMKVALQELKNNYAGKQAWDKKFNEINLKEQSIKREQSQFQEKISKIEGVKKQIDDIISNPEKNPLDALKIFLDANGVDSYDLMERTFKSQLTELANVLNMEPAERKAYFLERKNSHLLEQSKKRDEHQKETERVTSYRSKTDALRKSYGVSEAQYVDALEELKSFDGVDEKDLSEKEIVEWAATKPHRETVRTLLTPYKDQLVGDAYGELSWKLANILRSGEESPEIIKQHLAEVYGVPTEVKTLSKKLNPLGRKSKTPVKAAAKKASYESFDDIDDD